MEARLTNENQLSSDQTSIHPQTYVLNTSTKNTDSLLICTCVHVPRAGAGHGLMSVEPGAVADQRTPSLVSSGH